MKYEHERGSPLSVVMLTLVCIPGRVDVTSSQSGGQTGTPPREEIGGEAKLMVPTSPPLARG